MVLAACSAQPLPPPLSAGPGQETSTAAAEPPAVEPPSAPAAEPTPAEPRVAAMPAPRRGLESPARLVGLSREVVQDRLGPAAFVRRDGPVQIWRYAGDNCFLELFLYRESDTFRVHHVEARPKNPDQNGTEPVTVNGCYGRLLAARRSGGTG